MRFLCAILPLLFLFTSCGSSSSPVINTEAGAMEVKEMAIEQFGADLPVYMVDVMAYDHLTSDLHTLQVRYLKDGVDYTQAYALNPGQDPVLIPEKSGSQSFIERHQGSVNLGDLDFSLISKQFNAAVAMIPAEFENHELNYFGFNVSNENVLTTDLTIEATKVGEGTDREGLTEITNYYEFKFEGSADGQVVPMD